MRRYLTVLFFIFIPIVFFVTHSFAEVSLQGYCKDGYYQIPGEKKCSRAPKCGGYSYDDLNKSEFTPNNNDCLDEGHGMIIGDPPNSSAFYGYVPVCCYEMVRLNDPEMCIGYWERLWCHPDQCAKIDNAHGCGGGGCNCGHAMKGWCEIRHCDLKPPVPIEVRLGQKPQPTTPPQPTQKPTSAPTNKPVQPTSAPTLNPFPTSPPQKPQPTATPVPFSIGNISSSQPDVFPTFSPIGQSPNIPLVLPQGIKTVVRTVIVQANKGMEFSKFLFLLVKEKDAELERFMNAYIQNTRAYIFMLINESR